MIIANQSLKGKKKDFLKKNRIFTIVLLFTLLGVTYFFIQKRSQSEGGPIICDMEKVEDGQFLCNGRFFTGGETQSDLESHSGQFSSLLKKGEGVQWGSSYEVGNIKPGDVYEATVWVKRESLKVLAYLVVSGDEKSGLYRSSEQMYLKGEENWYQIRMVLKIPDFYVQNNLNVYFFSMGEGDAFFDDLTFRKLNEKDYDFSKKFTPQNLQIELPEKSYNKLIAKRNEAFRKNILITERDSWVKGEIKMKEENLPIQLRLKGDWLDHLEGDKWSFRVKVKSPNTWNRLITFSLQTPFARHFTKEWLLHQFWKREDVLTTDYDFLRLELNGKTLGIYAYEEHFEKQLVESKARREGPILRFSENALWDSRLEEYKNGEVLQVDKPAIGDMTQAEIKPFGASKISRSEKLLQHFELAHQLLNQFVEGLVKVDEIFDINRLAKYYAIGDIMGASHSQIWHNQRFYYNPILNKLEPIGYDGNIVLDDKEINLLGKKRIKYASPFEKKAFKNLFDDEVFMERYMTYLHQFTSPEYLDHFLLETDEGLRDRNDFMRSEFNDFHFDPTLVLQRAKRIRYKMKPYNIHSVKVELQEKKNKTKVLQISNIHVLPLLFIGISAFETLKDTLQKAIVLPAYRLGDPRVKRKVEVPLDAKYVFYKSYYDNTVYSSPILNWSVLKGITPYQELFGNIEIKTNKLYSVIGNAIRFGKGKYRVSNDVIIPKGYEVYFSNGVNIDFVEGAKFISKSPVFMEGDEDSPVYIYSSDKSANGFTVLESPAGSVLNYVVFEDFNTLSYKGWDLTGAVTFYESNVLIENCLFKNNHCEDGLNIIRSDFEMIDSKISGTFSDGFDADFCTGTISHCQISDTGNDGIDVSGSQINIDNCKLENCGDKGISVGEESKVIVDKTLIKNAIIGAASKDLSYLKLRQTELKNCNQGFVAYQKKPEFGPSTIVVQEYKEENVNHLYTLGLDCVLDINEKVIVGE